ncbi:MAG: hypothetical protein ACR652_24585 [Methylocystis sp.]|uniref:hypothetical protein n=1 Tax=Methylocystis sp. TaxID=1911079 RepID=UPI003DA24945
MFYEDPWYGTDEDRYCYWCDSDPCRCDSSPDDDDDDADYYRAEWLPASEGPSDLLPDEATTDSDGEAKP